MRGTTSFGLTLATALSLSVAIPAKAHAKGTMSLRIQNMMGDVCQVLVDGRYAGLSSPGLSPAFSVTTSPGRNVIVTMQCGAGYLMQGLVSGQYRSCTLTFIYGSYNAQCS